MFERVRFFRYALRFERAYRRDDWSAVRRCFHDDASYTVTGAPPFDGVARGAGEVMAFFKRMLDQFDRRFDRRIPKLTSWLRVRRGVLTVSWRARYVIGEESCVLDGVTECQFERGRIIRLQDTCEPEQCRRAWELVERAGKPVVAD